MLDYVENPKRSLYLTEKINVSLFNKILPKVLKLRAKSADPICLYLDSQGGHVHYAEKLHEIIKAPRQDGSDCRLIAIVPSLAASAAADLLILSDYAIVYPSALILCHGTRMGSEEVTMDNIKDYERNLKQSNKAHALKLARAVCVRLIQRLYIHSVQQSEEIARSSIKGVEIVSYLQNLEKITSDTKEFIDGVIESWNSKQDLYAELASLEDAKPDDIIQKIVERQTTELGDETVLDHVIEGMANDVSDLIDFVEGYADQRAINSLTKISGELLLTEEEQEALEGLRKDGEEDEKMFAVARDRVSKAWQFSVHFCHCLHSGENIFNSVEAYSIGLVDEIVGMTEEYPSERSIHESAEVEIEDVVQSS